MKHVAELLGEGPTLSFEFFPPASEAAQQRLDSTIHELAVLQPSFVSVTCGAGGQGHDRTRDLVIQTCQNHPFQAVAHLTCVGHSRAEVDRLLDMYTAGGVGNILALAGDPPDEMSAPGGDFRYAIELVEVIREHPAGFGVGVAAHPEVHPRSTDRDSDRRHLADKLTLADFAITQFFFNTDHYTRMMDELAALGCDRPVIPGVMPVLHPQSVRRFAKMNGTEVPEELFAQIAQLPEADRVTVAADAAAALTQELLDAGAPGVHLYTLNRSAAAVLIVQQLGLFTSESA